MRQRKTLDAETVDRMKTGGMREACERYGLGYTSMRKVAEDAAAIIRIGNRLIINFSKVDAYMDGISQ